MSGKLVKPGNFNASAQPLGLSNTKSRSSALSQLNCRVADLSSRDFPNGFAEIPTRLFSRDSTSPRTHLASQELMTRLVKPNHDQSVDEQRRSARCATALGKRLAGSSKPKVTHFARLRGFRGFSRLRRR